MVADDRNGVPRQDQDAKRPPLGRKEYLVTHAISRLTLAALMGSTAIALVPSESLAACVNVGGSNYECSGDNTVGQDIVQDNAFVTTVPGFSVDADAGIAVDISGTGALIYSDDNSSYLTGNYALQVVSLGDEGATPGSIMVATGGTLIGGTYGIYTLNSGTGATTVTTTGTAEGGAAGIGAFNDLAATDLAVEAADVSGNVYGIYTGNFGTGTNTITSTGTVHGDEIGIFAFNEPTATDLTIEAFNVSGGNVGIRAENGGHGATAVTATGMVSGTFGSGLSVQNGTTATDLTIEAANVSGGASGIFAENNGTGETSVTATGPATGANGMGIVAWNAATAGDLSVAAVDASGAIYGIGVANGSTAVVPGDTVVSASGTVSGGQAGIRVVNGGVDVVEFLAGNSAAAVTPGGNTLIILAADVSGGEIGIDALNNGTGETWIGTTGIVEGTANHGIRAVNATTATDLTIEAVTVTGGWNGISADNGGTGETSVSATGLVQGADGTGIAVSNQATATDLTIETATVTGAVSGISALNLGTGTTSITATGTVTGASQHGIRALNEAATTENLLVYAADVSGGIDGIYAENFGQGGTAVDASGTVTGGDDGIYAMNTATTTDLTIDAVDVAGGTYGVNASNSGTGSTRVTTTGTVQGGEAGIRALNDAGTLQLRVEAADVQSDLIGIEARNNGIRETTVITTGTVHGANTGIYALNGATTTDLAIEAADVSGAGYGIYGENDGTGATSITATGLVEGVSGTGIRVWTGPATTGLTVNAADTSGRYGIYTQHQGTGATDITVTGLAEGTAGTGILAHNAGATGDLTVTAADASGAIYGIGVANGSTAVVRGNTVVTATGTVDGGFAGILAINGTVDPADFVAGDLSGGIGAGGGDLTIQAADVTGGTYGIYAQNNGVGGTTITTNGTVIGPAAIVASGNAIGLTNNGTLLGLISLDSAATDFTNNGTWNGAGGESSFTGGASTLVNTGSVIGGVAAGIAEAATWSGLGQFTTQGLVTLADGGSGDVVTTTGNAEFAAGSVLAVDVGGAGSTDLFLAEGVVDLVGGPTLEASISGPLLYGHRYAVLTAEGGLTGTFGDLVLTNLPAAFLTIENAYDASNAYLQTVQIRDLADAALTPNQTATAGALDDLGAGAAFEAVVGSVDDASARFAFDQLSGELHASIAGTFIADSRVLREAATNRIRGAFAAPGSDVVPILAYGPGGPELEPADPELLAAWGLAAGVWSERDGDGNAAGIESDSRYFIAGADGFLGDWRIGLLGGYSQGSFGVPDRASSAEADSWHLGLYGGTEWNDLAFRTGLIQSWHNVTTSRTAAFPGFAETLDADYAARTLQLLGELAYGLDAGRVAFEPFAGLAYVRHDGGSYAETGGSAALSAAGSVIQTTFATLGLRAETDLALGVVEAQLHGSLAWQHAFGNVTPSTTHAFAGGGPFTVAGAPLAEDAALVEAGLDLTLSPTATFGLSYGGQFAANASDHAFRANLQVKF